MLTTVAKDALVGRKIVFVPGKGLEDYRLISSGHGIDCADALGCADAV